MTTRVLTMNEKDTLSYDVARADLLRVLDQTNPDLGGLQEWQRHRDSILEASGYSWTRPAQGGGPVFWDEQRYRLRACQAIRLARTEFVGHLPGRRSRLGPSWCTEVVLDDLASRHPDGEVTVVLDFHLTAEVQDMKRGGKYRRDLAHRLRVRRHKREKRRLGKRARWHKRRGRTVYLLGDSNFDGFKVGRFVSCWANHKGGTLGHRAVDVVLAATHPFAPPRTFKTASDHRAVLVVYKNR